MRYLICGDREWSDLKTMLDYMSTLPKDTIIVEGECRGADKMSRVIAEELGFSVEPYPADWKRYGRAAGPIRNRQMITESQKKAAQDGHKLVKVVAFHKHIETSTGTKDMLSAATKASIETETVK